jgi:hypothetical protein
MRQARDCKAIIGHNHHYPIDLGGVGVSVNSFIVLSEPFSTQTIGS